MDLKPSNVIMSEKGPVMIDFGIARVDNDETRLIERNPEAATERRPASVTGDADVVGTPNYMAPEQLRGGAVDRRVDIFALGIVLFELLTGHKPWDLDGVAFEELADRRADLNPLSGIAQHIKQIVLKAIAEDPEDRYQSAGEMLAELVVAGNRQGSLG